MPSAYASRSCASTAFLGASARAAICELVRVSNVLLALLLRGLWSLRDKGCVVISRNEAPRRKCVSVGARGKPGTHPLVQGVITFSTGAATSEFTAAIGPPFFAFCLSLCVRAFHSTVWKSPRLWCAIPQPFIIYFSSHCRSGSFSPASCSGV